MNAESVAGVIVIVEDPFITKFLHSALSRAGESAISLSPKSAMEFMDAAKTPVRALITNTPQMFRPHAGQFPLIYTSSCPVPEAVDGFPVNRTVRKPFHAAQVLDAIHEVCIVGLR